MTERILHHFPLDPASRQVRLALGEKRLAFTDEGIKVIEQTKRLRDIVDRNAKGLGNAFVGMTRKEWKRA